MPTRPRRLAPSRRRVVVGLTAGALLTSLAAPASASEDDEWYRYDACPAEQLADPGFSDLALSSAPVAVACLGEYGIARGTTGGTFDGQAPVTRRQMATFLHRLGTYEGVRWTRTDLGFSDLDGVSGEQRDAVGALAGAGIALGREQQGRRVYLPDEVVTRGQMAAFLNRLEARVQSTAGGYGEGLEPRDMATFDDDAGAFQPDIRAVATAGLALGVGGDRFAPDQPVTRTQMARFLARTLDQAQLSLSWLDGLPRAPYDAQDETGQARPKTAQERAPGATATYTFTGLDAAAYRLTLTNARNVVKMDGSHLFLGTDEAAPGTSSVVEPGRVVTTVDSVDGGPAPSDGVLRPTGGALRVVLRAGADDEVVLPVLHRGGPTDGIDLAVGGPADLPAVLDEISVGGPLAVVPPTAPDGAAVHGTVTGGRSTSDVLSVRQADGTSLRLAYDDTDVFEVGGQRVGLAEFEDEVDYAVLEATWDMVEPVGPPTSVSVAAFAADPAGTTTFRLSYDAAASGDLRADRQTWEEQVAGLR